MRTLRFCVEGKGMKIEQNEYAANEIENGTHLLLWSSNEKYDLWVDKYDVRILLENYDDFQSKYIECENEGGNKCEKEKRLDGRNGHENGLKLEEDEWENQDEIVVDETELSFERYQDLERLMNDCENDQQLEKIPKEEVEELYSFPSHISIPSTIEIPKTRSIFNVIAHTTKSIRGNPQLEILLRVKQSDNPTFSFLQPGKDFYPFYQFLKQLEDTIFWDLYLDRQVSKQLPCALTLLRSSYDNDDDNKLDNDDDDDNNPNNLITVEQELKQPSYVISQDHPSTPSSSTLITPHESIPRPSHSPTYSAGVDDVVEKRAVFYNQDDYDEDVNLFSDEDCEKEKFWMRKHFQRWEIREQKYLTGELTFPSTSTSSSSLTCMGGEDEVKERLQKERLQKAKLLSGYYSLQLQAIENTAASSRNEMDEEFQNEGSDQRVSQSQKREEEDEGSEGNEGKEKPQIGYGDSQQRKQKIELRLDHNPSNSKKQRRIANPQNKKIYQEIQEKVFSSFTIDPVRLKNKIDQLLQSNIREH